jgi:hypothetical protein
VALRELDQELHCVLTRLGVRVRQDNVRGACRGDPLVRVGGEAEGLIVDDQVRVDLGRGRVRDDDELIYLRPKGLEAALELRIRPVGDDDGGDAATQSSSR